MQHENDRNQLLSRIDALQREIDFLRNEILESNDVPAKQAFQPAKKEANTGFSVESFIGLNIIHFVGIIVLIIGITIGVKHAIDINLITPNLRIILAYAASAALLLLSFKLLKKYQLFSHILFSGAMASAYFTTYAAYEYYQMMPSVVAFIIMLVLTVFTVIAALRYERQVIAILGLVGAYAIPIFVSGEQSSIAVLYSYVLFINIGVLVISFKKYWPSLTYTGFIATWVIYFAAIIGEGDEYWQFAFAFFILFLINTLAFKVIKKIELDISDTIIVAANSFMLYCAIVLRQEDINDNVRYTTLAFGVIYMVASLLSYKVLSSQRHLSNLLIMVSVTAFSIYALIAFGGFAVTIIWVLMAVVCFVLGMKTELTVLRRCAIVLFAATLVKLVMIDAIDFTSVQKVIAYVFTGTVLLVVSFLYQKYKSKLFGK